jgi:hypothetical protein
MKTVKGRYNGSVVVLDEPAPVDHEVEVTVQFPEALAETVQTPPGEKKWHWEEARALLGSLGTSVSEELRRQRDMEQAEQGHPR